MAMAFSPNLIPEKPLDFRAPPPSPVATGRRPFVANDEVLTDYLESSLRVPDLILPDRVFPLQKQIQKAPKLDFQSLNSDETNSIAAIVDSIGQLGCFELVNHGISSDLIRSVASDAGAGIFRIPPEKKGMVSREPEKPYGFVEFHGEEERDMCEEEFVWGREELLKLKMEGIWPNGEYSNFSDKMEILMLEIEKIAGKFLVVLQRNVQSKWTYDEDDEFRDRCRGRELCGSICYLSKHGQQVSANDDDDDDESKMMVKSLRYDVIRMVIRGSEYSHALCFHICDGSSEFHVYSKRGWVSFSPDINALVVTLGDKIQAWSGGQYKHVIGRPIFRSGEEDCISMAFLYAPPTINHAANMSIKGSIAGKTLSIRQQAILALILTLVYRILIFMYSKF